MMSSKYKNLEPDWIFFGGTFDPPHRGHMDAVRIVRDCFKEAEVVVVPSFAPPVSKDSVKSVTSEFIERVAMCVLAFDEWDRVQVSALEQDLAVPSYTVRTVQDLRAEYPSSKLAWMIGADQLTTFTNWMEPRAILEAASLIILPRPAQVFVDLVDAATQMATSLGFQVSIDREAGVILLDGGTPIFVLKEAPSEVSSSEVRDLLKVNPTALSDKLPAAVLEYIGDLELYSSQREGITHG